MVEELLSGFHQIVFTKSLAKYSTHLFKQVFK